MTFHRPHEWFTAAQTGAEKGYFYVITETAPMNIGNTMYNVTPSVELENVIVCLEGITDRLALYVALGKRYEWFSFLLNQLAILYYDIVEAHRTTTWSSIILVARYDTHGQGIC